MKYFKSYDGTKIRIDTKADKAFAKFSDGKEKPMPHPSTTVTDIIIENKPISESEYAD